MGPIMQWGMRGVNGEGGKKRRGAEGENFRFQMISDFKI
jgi:hypothetical protein